MSGEKFSQKNEDDLLEKALDEAMEYAVSKLTVPYPDKIDIAVTEMKEAVTQTMTDIVDDLIDVFGRELFEDLAKSFQNLSGLSNKDSEKILKKISDDKSFIVSESLGDTETSYDHNTGLFINIKGLFLSYDHLDVIGNIPILNQYLANIKEICERYPPKKRKQKEAVANKMFLSVLKDLGFKLDKITINQIKRFIYLTCEIQKNEDYLMELDSIDVARGYFDSLATEVLLRARSIGLQSLLFLLYSDPDELKGRDNIKPLIEKLSRVQASQNRSTGKQQLYEKYLPKLHKVYEKRKNKHKKSAIIGDFCKSENNELISKLACSDKGMQRIEEELNQLFYAYLASEVNNPQFDNKSWREVIDIKINMLNECFSKQNQLNKQEQENLQKLGTLKDSFDRRLQGYQKSYLLSPVTMTNYYNKAYPKK